MVGIVLVSHSRSLAQALTPLLREMSGTNLRIEVAAGAGEDGDAFGTSAPDICTAIETADDGDGVVVLLDMSSAVTNAGLALKSLDPDVAERTRFLAASFVEGAVSASVAASGNASIDQVVENARTALQQKQDALPDDLGADADSESPGSESGVSESGVSGPASSNVPATGDSGEASIWDATAEVEVMNEHGLHAHSAAQFVRMALSHTQSQNGATVQVSDLTNDSGPVDATSQSTVTTLGAVRGHTLRIQATGPGAENIVSNLADLVASGFGERDDRDAPNAAADDASAASSPPPASGEPDAAYDTGAEMGAETGAETGAGPSSAYPPAVRKQAYRGISVQPGTAMAPGHVHRPTLPTIPKETTDDPEASWEKLSAVLDAVSEKMEQERSRLQSQGHTDAADILGAQQLLLDDPALRNRAHANISEKHYDAPRAWMDAVDDVIQAYSSAEDTYLSQRADDVRDVAVRVLHVLVDVTPTAIEGPASDHILITRRIRPSDVPALDVSRVRAVVCAEGNATSHSAILLRGRDIPTIFDAGPDVLGISEGTPVAVDAGEGLFWMDPSDETREQVEHVHAEERAAQEQAEASAHEPARTTDGTTVTVSANISQTSEGPIAEDYGADGVGLLRTEFLFAGRDEPPQESEQLDALLQISAAMEKKEITVRALDAGGDKPINYLPLPDEANPFLGLRGIRVLIRHPDLFRRQLRAVLRLAVDVKTRLMLPMVCTVGEVRQAREILADARAELDERGLSPNGALPLGTMIETPASALSASTLAEEVDFFSIGTNDLAQYTMAADREHGGLGTLTDALHPPVLHLIRETAEAAKVASIPVSVCGEVASDEQAVPILLGLGVTHLSVTPRQIPAVKALVRTLDRAACQRLAADCLRADDADAVRALSKTMLDGRDTE